jgi:hypothetical protein
MNKTSYLTLFFCLLLPGVATAQVSGYGSVSAGYHANPLFNYERIPDQMKQAYIELKHASEWRASRLNFIYIGGLVLFNNLESRNYYEQNLSGNYLFSFKAQELPSSDISVPIRDDDTTGSEADADSSELEDDPESEDEGDLPDVDVTMSPLDSTSRFIETWCTISARHDKGEFQEFDNTGGEFRGIYRTPMFSIFALRLTGAAGIRDYTHLGELSNSTGVISLVLGNLEPGIVNASLRLGGGLKHFLQTVYDTARFEPVRSYTEKPDGKGKPGAKIKVPSDKILLTNPGSINSFQLILGSELSTLWNGGSIAVGFTYRNNLGSASRLLAQYVNSSFLTDDIYNDYFSYGGEELAIRFNQDLPFGLEAIFSGEIVRKTFNAPAFNLAGNQTSDHREDLRTEQELYLQKFINISDHAGLGFFLSGTLVRNQSNDDYNDFSGWSLSAGVSIGFY